MFGFTRSRRPARPGRSLRSTLRLEELGLRAMPSGLEASPPPSDPPPAILNPPPVIAPFIDEFDATEEGHGLYLITGHVSAPNPEGLVVTFDGIPALEGRTAVCDADGNFALVITVQTNGNDSGTITAQTVDANGNQSNIALASVDPTP